MTAWLLAVLLVMLPGPPAWSQWQPNPGSWTAKTAPSYAGPGDVASGALAWYSCYWAYSAAYAAPGTNNGCNVRRASDNQTCDFYLTAAGTIGLSHNCSGAANGQSIATFAASTTVWATEAYDQTGNANHLTQATAAKQPQLLLSGCPSGSVVCMSFTGSSTQCLTGTLGTLAAGTYSVEVVFDNTLSGTYLTMFTLDGSGNYLLDMNAGTLDWYLTGDQNLAGTAINTWYAAVAVSGASGSVNANALTAAATRTNMTGSQLFGVGGYGTCGFPFTGYIGEAGIWPTALTPSTVISNARGRYGF